MKKFLFIILAFMLVITVSACNHSVEKEKTEAPLQPANTNTDIFENYEPLTRVNFILPSIRTQAERALLNLELEKNEKVIAVFLGDDEKTVFITTKINQTEHGWKYDSDLNELSRFDFEYEDICKINDEKKEMVMNNIVTPYIENNIIPDNISKYINGKSGNVKLLGYVGSYQNYYVLLVYYSKTEYLYMYFNYENQLLEVEKCYYSTEGKNVYVDWEKIN